MASNEGEVIQVDPAVLENSEDDDYLSSGYDTSTASLTSSIHQFVYQHGRRYHSYFGDEKNPMPTDEKEQDRLDMHHEILRQVLDGKVYLAPIGDKPQKILDIGTGTGIWAIDMADMFPSAQVLGTDLSPIQPHWVPPNCKFEIDDAETDWTYQPDSFDFIHVRNVSQGIANWEKVMRNIYNCTAPGGWVELAELGTDIFSDDNTAGPAFSLFSRSLDEAMNKIGRPQASPELLTARLKKAGFVDIVARTFKHPFGPWPKDKRMKQIGAMVMLNAETGAEAYGLVAFTRILGKSEEEAKKICRETIAEVKNKNRHIYTLYYVVYGRKPEAR